MVVIQKWSNPVWQQTNTKPQKNKVSLFYVNKSYSPTQTPSLPSKKKKNNPPKQTENPPTTIGYGPVT